MILIQVLHGYRSGCWSRGWKRYLSKSTYWFRPLPNSMIILRPCYKSFSESRDLCRSYSMSSGKLNINKKKL